MIARNYRTASRSAEADLVAWDGASLVFVEVKSRANAEFGAPELAVDQEKRMHILRAASEYIRHAEVPETCVRFDIVSIVFGETLSVRHIRDAFYWPRKAA